MYTSLHACPSLYAYFFNCLLLRLHSQSFFFFFNDTATTEIYTLSLHDALPICTALAMFESLPKMNERWQPVIGEPLTLGIGRSEEHTSELQSPCNLVCRLLLEKKKKK